MVAAVIGHVHLQVGDTVRAERFWRDLLGFEVTCRCPSGSFFGAGGYHHQLAANTWNSRGVGSRPDRMAGLRAGHDGDGAVLCDPWGTAISLHVGRPCRKGRRHHDDCPFEHPSR
jgi:catechol 2,3-dioxygenase